MKYYIEVLHKESYGGDNIAISWSGPGFGQRIISGRYPSPIMIGIPGDSSNDNSVDINDLANLTSLWLEDDCILTSTIDLDGNCIVDLYEFALLASNWLK